MAIREILTDQDPALHTKCHVVTRFDNKLARLLDDMKETLAKAGGAGLAAPQIGILRRAVIVVDGDGQMLELVNPELISQEGEITDIEGCLSIPDCWGLVKRPAKVRVRAQDRKGRWFETEGEEIVARCFCHELEHLDGHVFTEYAEQPLLNSEQLDAVLDEAAKLMKKSRR